MRTLILLLTLFLITSAQAERWPHAPLPSPDANGDFSGHSWNEMWKVVDSDPKGLNAREVRKGREYQEIASPKSGSSFLDLKVVSQLPKGTELLVIKTLKDDRNKPWLVVETYPRQENGRYLLVRAHKDFIKPIHGAWPRANKEGNYSSRTHRHWEVVDPDPQGLNGRQHPNFPKDLGDAGAVWPETTPDTWGVVTSLPKGTKLVGLSGHLGVIRRNGRDGAPWMLVTRMRDFTPGGDYSTFFVRAHKDYVKPIE